MLSYVVMSCDVLFLYIVFSSVVQLLLVSLLSCKSMPSVSECIVFDDNNN